MALAAQLSLAVLRQPVLGGVLFAFAAALALAADRCSPRFTFANERECAASSSSLVTVRPAHPRRAVVLLTFAVGVSFGVVPRLDAGQAYDAANVLWMVSLLGLLAAAAAWVPYRLSRWRHLGRREMGELIAVLAILALAALLRFPSNAEIPPEVHGDEALFGVLGRNILKDYDPHLFRSADNHLGNAFTALALQLFGDNLSGLRSGAAVGGILSILLLYGLARRLYGARPALIAAFLLAAAQWHIHYSRDGITVIHAVVATVLLLYLTVRAADSGHPVDYVLVGFATGLCLNVYYPARLAPILAGLYVAHRALHDRDLVARQWPGFLAAGIALLVFMAPFWSASLLAANDPRAAMSQAAASRVSTDGLADAAHDATHISGRTGNVLIFSPNNLQHAYGTYGVNRVEQALAIQTALTLTAFNFGQDVSDQYAHRAPLFDFWTAALLVPGVLLVTFRMGHSPCFLVASWTWLTLLFGGVLTAGPFTPRITSVLPALVIPPALVLDAGWRTARVRWGESGARAIAAAVAAFLVLVLGTNMRDYFQVHITKHQPSQFYTVLARELAVSNSAYRAYVVGYPFVSLGYSTVEFIAGDVDGDSLPNEPITAPLRDTPPYKGAAFFIQAGTPIHDERVRQIKAIYPGGRLDVVRSSGGAPVLTRYLVEHSELVAAARRAAATP